MKKITFFIMMLLSVTAFSQVEIVENFDTTDDWELPAGWTTTLNGYNDVAYNVVSFNQCGGTGKSVYTIANTDFGTTPWDFDYILTTPNYPAITNNTDLTVSFSVNVFQEGAPFFFPPLPVLAPEPDWGSVTLEYTVDGGSNWITAVTVNPADLTFVDVNTCTTIPATNLGPLAAGNDFQARFVSNLNNIVDGYFALNVVIDNISITQVATTVPNCDAALTSPLTDVDLDTTLTWSNATGLPTGYNLSVGTAMGGTDIVNAATVSGTSYSLDGLGLTYSTPYYVNIVPFNSFGDATGCTEEIFTTRAEPVPGATCSNAIVIPSPLPYFQPDGDTGLSENNITEGPCFGFASAYLNGPDVIYSYTPTTDVSINIALAGVDAFSTAIHVFNGCGDNATECVASIGDTDFSALPHNLELNEVVLLAGNTYTIVLSSGNNSYQYNLIITQNSCINPDFTLSTTEDCANDQFFVDVDITYLGDATSLTLSDNFGNTDTGINTIGTRTGYGPYPTGSTVEFTLTNDQDNACSYMDSIFYYCPPSNDDCVNAIDLTSTINTDDTCTILTSANNVGASENASNPVTCDFTGTNDIWFSFVASSEIMILEYLNVVDVIGQFGTNQSTELLEGSCGTFTSLRCYTNVNYVTLNGLTIGNTYYLRNMSSSTNIAQSYDLCLREAPAPPANDECANAIVLTVSTDENCDNTITGTTVGATPSAENTCNEGFTEFWKDVWYEFTATETGLYQFSFTPTDFDSYYYIYSGTCGALVGESANCFNTTQPTIQSLNNGDTRYIMVRSSDREAGFEFDLCVWQLPPAVSNDDCSTPTVLLESTDSNGNNMISGDFANSYPSPEACATTANTIWYSFTPSFTGTYNFNLTPTSGFPYYSVFNTDDCSNTSGNFVTNSGCFGTGMLTTDLVAGNTYLISLYNFGGTDAFEFVAYPDPSLSAETNNFETFKYFPNPVINSLTVEAKNNISNIDIFNILGQQVQTIEPNTRRSVIDMNELKDGVYFVTITIENSKKTIKVVKK